MEIKVESPISSELKFISVPKKELKMLKCFFIITVLIGLCSSGFAANNKTEKEESCNWGCKLPYNICLEKGVNIPDKEKIKQVCYTQEKEDPRDCVFESYRKLAKENRYESLKNRCKSEKLKCIKECLVD